MTHGKQIDGIGIETLDQWQFEFAHEPRGRHPEVVADHDHALHVFAIALPECRDQFGIGQFVVGMQPLFKLIENDQDLLCRSTHHASTQRRQNLLQRQILRK